MTLQTHHLNKMYRNTGIMILLCTCLSLVSMRAQENSVSAPSSCVPVRDLSDGNLAFASGEKMYFTMHYEWGMINSDIGSAVVSLDQVNFNGQKAFKCSVTGKTTRLYDLFFKVREDFCSWFAVDGLRPLKFTRETYEGPYVAKNTYIYNWDAAEPYIAADVYTSSMGQKNLQLPLTRCTFDLPALFFFARNIDMDKVQAGRKYPMTFAIDDEIYNVHFIFYGKETINVTGLGKVNAIKFSARLIAGEVFKGDTDVMIWISDDQNKVPVYFEAPILVGTASGRMVGFEGLKYPFACHPER